MAPTEATILNTFLLPPAPLQSIISLKAFTGLFPRSQQSSPQIKSLYRDLQRQRAKLTDAVARNIIIEVKKGNAQRRAVVRVRKLAEREEQDDEIEIEHSLFGATSALAIARPHSLTSILPELQAATSDIEDEIRRLEKEADGILGEIQGTVGGLSDLRYGRLADRELPHQALEQLNRLETSCTKE